MNTDTEDKILVIDDEAGVRNLLRYELGERGYRIVTAENGEKGLEAIRNNKFQLVISDIKMPKPDGIELLDEIKKIDPDLEVIIITGYGTIDLAVSALKKGAYDFVQKPVNISEIVPLVEKALEKVELKALVKLYENSKAIFSATRLEDLLPVLVDLSRNILKADDVSIMLLGEGAALTIAASHGLENDDDKALRLFLGEKAIGELATSRDDVMVTGYVEKGAKGNVRQVRSSLLCPLLLGTKVLGALCAARTGSDVPFEASDKSHGKIFASQISQAIHNVQVYHELEQKIKELSAAYKTLSEIKGGQEQGEGYADAGKLFVNVAHRLKNALSIIMGLSEFLIENENQSEETRRDLRSIREQADQSCTIITNISRSAKKLK